MDTNERIIQLLESLIHVIGRVALPQEKVQDIIGNDPKYIKAYNLCDGTITQAEIVKKVNIDKGNLSRAIKRWVENGVLFSIGESKSTCMLHIYPIQSPNEGKDNKKGKRNTKKQKRK